MLNVGLGSIGAGAGGQQRASTKQSVAAILAQRCLQAALKNNTSAGHVWANLAAAYSMSRRMGLASQCLEQVLTVKCLFIDKHFSSALLSSSSTQSLSAQGTIHCMVKFRVKGLMTTGL